MKKTKSAVAVGSPIQPNERVRRIWSHENMPEFSECDVVIVRNPSSDWNGCSVYRAHPNGVSWYQQGFTVEVQ